MYSNFKLNILKRGRYNPIYMHQNTTRKLSRMCVRSVCVSVCVTERDHGYQPGVIDSIQWEQVNHSWGEERAFGSGRFDSLAW